MSEENNYKVITSCRSCGSTSLKQFLNLGIQPLANALRKKEEELPETKYPLVGLICEQCSTVQLSVTVSAKELFEDYVWVTNTSKTAREYSKIFADRVSARCPRKGFCVEVASNDGTFLKPLKERGWDVIGVDPAKNIARRANANGIKTFDNFFNKETALKILKTHGRTDMLIARNVIPHVEDIESVLQGIDILTQEESIVAIEFHRADTILKELHYDSFYHEHLYYHTLHSMQNLLNKIDLRIYDVEESPISGGSYVLYVSKKDRGKTKELQDRLKQEKDMGVDKLDKWIEFGSRTYDHREEMIKMIEELKGTGKKIYAYGASARSSTMMNFYGITSSDILGIYDKSEYKQGLTCPGTGIKILDPEKIVIDKPEVIIIFAWNFYEEIKEYIKDKLKYEVVVVKPLPYKPTSEVINGN